MRAYYSTLTGPPNSARLPAVVSISRFTVMSLTPVGTGTVIVA